MDTQTAESVGIVLPTDARERQEEVEKYVAASVQMLADDLSKGASENMLKLLAFFARLHTYSAKNKLLIMLQKPDASYVASYTRWKQLDRQVAKGSKAIYVYGPVTRKEQDAVTGEQADRVLGFRLLPVFDATSLTDIDEHPLPSLWTPLPDDAGPTALGLFCRPMRERDRRKSRNMSRRVCKCWPMTSVRVQAKICLNCWPSSLVFTHIPQKTSC